MNKHAVEALLFVSKEPVTLEKISKILNEEAAIVSRWLSELEKEYEGKGIVIRRVAGGFEMVTNSKYHEVLDQVILKKTISLPKAVIETISVVSSNQPVNKATIARYRGVKNPESGVDRAVELGLIEETDKGFVTTNKFLKQFGLNDLRELEEYNTKK